MNRKFIFAFALVSAALVSTVAQADDWNLKGLDTVSVDVLQGAPVISQNTMLQLDTDTKLKLKSAGLSLASPQDAKALVDINIKNIKGITNEWVVVELLVLEKVQASSRKGSQKVNAITYMDEAFFETPMGAADKKIYDTALNGLITKFVASYLNQNSK